MKRGGEHKTSKHYGPFVAKLPSVLFNLSYCNVLYYVSLYGQDKPADGTLL